MLLGGEHVERLLEAVHGKYGAILIDPPWRFANRTGKVAPEHKRLRRYATMSFQEIAALPVGEIAASKSHLYLWSPNALLAEALNIMKAWGFTYKTNIVWYKVRKDGGPDGRGVGFYFRNVTELLLFGIKGKIRTLGPGRRQVNILTSRKQEHSRKPDAVYDLIQRCSLGPYCELFSRQRVAGWTQWGDELDGYEAAPHRGYTWSPAMARCNSSPPQPEGADTRQQNLHLSLE
jgi:N6-adenosine-specific RNA methylase IME4